MRWAFAFAAAVSAIAAFPDDNPSHWYTPKNGWKGGSAGIVRITNEDGSYSYPYSVDDSGYSPALEGYIAEMRAAGKGFEAVADAYQALYEALQAQIMVRNMATKLDELFDGGTADISATDGSSNPNGSYNFSIGKNGKVELTLKGVSGVTAGRGLSKINGQIGMYNWNGEGEVGSVAEVLGSKSMDYKSTWSVVVRTSPGGTLTYLPLGFGIGGGSAPVDGVTVVTNGGAISLHGWAEDGVAIANSTYAIPYAHNASGGLKWAGFAQFFDTSLFDFVTDGADGRIRLKGYDGGEMGANKYFGTGGEGGGFGFFDVAGGVAFDDATITTNGTGMAHLVGISGDGAASEGQVPYANGNGGIEWGNPPPTVSFNDSDGTLTISPSGNDDTGDTVVALPYMEIEDDGEYYVFSWFDYGSGDGYFEIPKSSGSGVAFDDVSLTTNGTGKAHVVGVEDYAGKSADHYFGTGSDKSLGWHELPNVTTNSVAGDELTITSVDAANGVKTLGLRGWPPAVAGVPYGVGSVGGALAFLPLPEIPTNAPCGCSNRWEALYGWLGDGTSSDAHGIDFTTESLGARVGDLGFVNTNDLDRMSISETDGGKVQISGFSTAMRCNADLSSMLKNPDGEDAGKHLLLANYQESNGTRTLHYLPIGEGIAESAGVMVDNASITTNDGKIAIFGYGANESKGKFLKHGADTGVEWVDVPTNDVDDASIEIHDGKLQIVGFDQAEPNSVPRKDENGRVAWSGASSATNTYVAGSYIEMTDNGGGVVTVSAQSKTLDVITGISFSFNADNQLVATVTKQTITVLDKADTTSETTATVPLWKQDVVIASEYSTSTHAFKNTSIGGVRTVETLPSQPSQTTVFTATAHSGQ